MAMSKSARWKFSRSNIYSYYRTLDGLRAVAATLGSNRNFG